MGQGGLAGLRVLELGTNENTALLGRLMADHGADVITISHPKDHGRKPDAQDAISARNKARITLNPSHPEGQELLLRLSMKVDFLISGAPLSELKAGGLSPETLATTNPGLITIALGEETPAEDSEGDIPFAHLSAVTALVGALAALQHRHRTGQGQVVQPHAASALANLQAGTPSAAELSGENSGWFVEHHPELGQTPMPNVTPELSVSPGTVRREAVAIGADNEHVYGRLLGLERSKLQELASVGII